MDLADYERLAARTLNPTLDETGRLMDAAAGLAEESGEVLSIVRKHCYQRRPLDRRRLTEELGDALWCLTMLARGAGLSLQTVADANIAKLSRRHKDGFSFEPEAPHE